MNIDSDALTRAYALAHDSGKVDDGRLMRALKLVPTVQHTFEGTYTDGTHMDEYWIPGNDRTGYSITVRDNRIVGACQCKDHGRNKPMICKHRASVMLITKALLITPEAETVAVSVPMADDYRARIVAALWPQDND